MVEFPSNKCYFCNSSFIKNTLVDGVVEFICLNHPDIIICSIPEINQFEVIFEKPRLSCTWNMHDGFQKVQILAPNKLLDLNLSLEEFISRPLDQAYEKITTLLLFN